MQTKLDRSERKLQQRGDLAQAQVLEVAKHDDFTKRFGQLGGRLADDLSFRLGIKPFRRIWREVLLLGKFIA